MDLNISVVIPVYNVCKYLALCVESVQKLAGNIQIVLVDDGSTDGSGRLCDELAAQDARIQVVHQENGGLSAARNAGIRSSTGDYILFLDSDDLLDAAATDEMLRACDSGADVILGMYQNYYEDTQRYEKESCDGFLSCSGLTPIDRFLEAVPTDGRSCYMIACRFVLRRDFLLKNQLFFMPGIYHEDEEWTQRMLCCADGVYVTHCFFYRYRQAREGAITATVRPKHISDTFTVLSRTVCLYDRQKGSPAKANYLKHRAANLYLNNMLNLYVLDKQQRKLAYKELLSYRGFCAPWLSGTVGKTVRLSDRVFGLRFTCLLLRILRKLAK